MKILANACAPGAAKTVAPVVSTLRAAGHDVTLLSLHNTTPATARCGGASAVFDRLGLSYREAAPICLDPTAVPTSVASGLITETRPDRIVVGTSRDPSGVQQMIEDALIAAGHVSGIPTVQIVDSWDVWFPRRAGQHATRLAVPDEMAARVVQHRGGLPDEAIVATGQPAFDRLGTRGATVVRALTRRALGLTCERVVVYCSQVNSDNPTTLAWVIDEMGPNDRLLFQRHPRDTREYGPLLGRASDRLLPLSDSPLAIGDVCVTHHSSVGIEALLAGLGLINILLDGELADVREICGGYPLSSLGLSHEAHSADEVQPEGATGLWPGALVGSSFRPGAGRFRSNPELRGRTRKLAHVQRFVLEPEVQRSHADHRG